MDGIEFERFLQHTFEQGGFETSRTTQSNDRGVDLFAEKKGMRYAIQAKHYSKGNSVGSSAVQKTSGLLSRPDIDRAILITTSAFTSEAMAVAENRNVVLMSIDDPLTGSKNITNSNSTESEDSFSHAPRIQFHQKEAGISIENNSSSDTATKDEVELTTDCNNCGTKINGNKNEHITHWIDCELPNNRPTHIPVDVWWDIKSEVKETIEETGENTEQQNNPESNSNAIDQGTNRDSHTSVETTDSNEFINAHSTAVPALLGIFLLASSIPLFVLLSGLLPSSIGIFSIVFGTIFLRDAYRHISGN